MCTGFRRIFDLVSNMTEQDAVVAAEKVVADLEAKRRVLIEARAADDAERRAVAFAAHSNGGSAEGKAARATLDKLNAAAVRFDSEFRSIEDAVAVAQDRLQQARQQEAIEADKAAAREAVKVLDELCEHGTVLDDALADAVTAGANLRDCLNRLHNLGISHPSHEMLHTIGNLAFRTAMTKSIWSRYHEAVAPKDRVSFAAVVASWREHLMADVRRRLGEAEHTEEAA
jgi:hypothetical protein